MWFYVLEPLTLGPHAAKLGGFMHCSSGDKAFSICDMISKDHIMGCVALWVKASHSGSPPCHD